MELFWLLYPSCYQLIAFIWLIFWTSTLLVFFYSFLLSDVKVLHFCVLLLLYLLTLAGNTVIILLSYLDRHLHKPMYSFLGNLTFLDICYPSTTMPKILQVLPAKTKSTTFIGCLTQLYLFVAFVGTEHVLLLIMSYDRFLAVCQPLRYMVMMSQSVCIGLVFVCWFTGIVYSSVHTASNFVLTFVEPRRSILFLWHPTTAFSFLRQYIYCINEVPLLSIWGFLRVGTIPEHYHFLYIHTVIVTIMKIKSEEGRQKAFSTCASDLLSSSCIMEVLFSIMWDLFPHIL